MGFGSTLREMIFKLDFFYTAEVLRYKQEPEYRTMFGGILSISIIIALLVTFYNKVIDTFDKVIISSAFSAINADDPTSYMISTMPGKPFMFGVELWHHDLNANPRYFDVVLTNRFFDTGESNQNRSIVIPLQPCTKQHWSEYPKVAADYQRLSINYWLCLPKNGQYEIFGKYASVTSKTLQVAVRTCTNSSDFQYPCAPQADIDALWAQEGSFFYTIYFINPLINPDSQEYLSYYLQDSNYVIFSQTGGSECQLWMEDFTITTDQSIIPFAQTRVQTGGIITKNCIKNVYSIDPAEPEALYSTMMFFKSPISRSIDRSFQKIDQILAYIGGLFGTIAICLFLVNLYNSYSFEIAMGGYLFKPNQEGMSKQLTKYNFLYFLLHLFYMLLSQIKLKPNWKVAKLYYDCREEMIKQLDILLLYRRIAILERAMTTLLTKGQIRALHLYQNPTLEEAKKWRRSYKINHDSFIYRMVHQHQEALGSMSMIRQRPLNHSQQSQKRHEGQKDPHLGTGQAMHISPSNKKMNNSLNISFDLNKILPEKPANHLQKPQFLNEHSESSDSQPEDQIKAENQQVLSELRSLKEQVEERSNAKSKLIWNRLGERLKKVVNYSLEYAEDSHQKLEKQDNIIIEPPYDHKSKSQSRMERKQKMKRFRQLPQINMEQHIKTEHLQQGSDDKSSNAINEASVEHFIDMEDLSPVKKRN